jgi:multiple antibiotic resistance protein
VSNRNLDKSVDWAEIIKFFAALFAIMNPLGNIPVFLSVTDGRSDRERAHIAAVASGAVAAILGASVLVGALFLDAFGISIAGLRTAGGLIVLSIAYSLLQAQPSGMHHGAGDAAPQDDPAVYPLAMPLLAGPGAIATAIVFAHGAAGTAAHVGLVGVVVLMAALLYAAMRLAVPVSRLLGDAGMNVATRLMGIVLAAIAVQMIFAGARVLMQG